MANGLKIFLRLVVVLLMITAIVGAVLYFTTRTPDEKQAFASYSELVKVDNFKNLNEKVAYSETNQFVSYGNSIANHSEEFKTIAKCYDASITVFNDLCANLYYISNSNANERKSINEKLANLKSTSAKAVSYAQIFEDEMNTYTIPRTAEQEAEILKTFNLFQAKFLEHTNLMCQLNFEIYNFVTNYALNGSSDLSLKYQLLGIIAKQCKVASDASSDFSVYTKHFVDIDKFLAKYKQEKTTNFVNGSKQSNRAYKFLTTYKSIEQSLKESFINSGDKTTFYKDSLNNTDKALFDAVYDYFGFTKGA